MVLTLEVVALFTARLALAAVFAVAGLAKLNDTKGSRKSLGDFGVPTSLTPAAAVLLPSAELACALALLRDRWAIPGAVGVITLLAVFSASIAVSLARGRTPSCHCFGQLSSSPVSWWTLVRNLVLLMLASVVAWKVHQGPSAWPTLPESSFETAILVSIAVLAAVLALTLWLLFHMLQQNGRLLLRLEAVEKKLNIDPNVATVQGRPVGDPAPAFELKAVGGGAVSLQMLGERSTPILLVFTEPGCGACQSLVPELAQWQREHAERVMIVPVSRGEEELNRTKSAAHGLSNVLLQADREVAQAYLVTATPSAVLVAEGKIASRIAAGSDAIRALITRVALPPPVKQGDVVPSVKLPDLDGKIVDLATLHGRRTLLLFWNPSCGFCQKMLPDLKTWKRSQTAPEVVVISSGSPEANRDQGFRLRVLLDPSFGSGQVFGATGTPSAVVLDEEGRVASEVGVGAPAIFALAGAEVPASRP
jgi:peroxiredoxin